MFSPSLNWAVWSDLISPVPYSLHMVHYQMKVLESYLSDPEMHVEVCGDPNFSGGPFVNVPIERVHEVEQMLQEMKTRQAGNVRLAHAVPEFCNYINEQAKGQSQIWHTERPGMSFGLGNSGSYLPPIPTVLMRGCTST